MSATQAKLVKSWLNYAEGDGQKIAPELQYAPLPDAILPRRRPRSTGCSATARPSGAAEQAMEAGSRESTRRPLNS